MLGELPCRLHWNQAKGLLGNPGKIWEWQMGGRRSQHLTLRVCYGPCCETASRRAAQHYHQVMEQERLWVLQRNRGMGWVKGRFSFLSPWKGHRKHRRASGTRWGSGHHVPQTWVGVPRTRLFSLSLWIWEFTLEGTESQVRVRLWGCFTKPSPPLTFSLCRKKAFSNRNFDGAITLGTLKKTYIYKVTCLTRVQDKSLTCQKILSEKKQAFMYKRITWNYLPIY